MIITKLDFCQKTITNFLKSKVFRKIKYGFKSLEKCYFQNEFNKFTYQKKKKIKIIETFILIFFKFVKPTYVLSFVNLIFCFSFFKFKKFYF